MYYVYILASRHYGTLYVGSTTNLDSFEAMLTRERRIKGWKRDSKINLIEKQNPHWVDLYPTLPP